MTKGPWYWANIGYMLILIPFTKMCVCQTDFEIRFLFPIHKNIKLDSIAYNWICYVLWMIHNEMEIKFGLSLQKFERFRPKCWKKLQKLTNNNWWNHSNQVFWMRKPHRKFNNEIFLIVFKTQQGTKYSSKFLEVETFFGVM